MGLKTQDSLSEKDWDFVKKLTKVARVKVLSHQVSLSFDKSDRDLGTDDKNRLSFPENWSLQYVGIEPSRYEDDHIVRMTWKIIKT